MLTKEVLALAVSLIPDIGEGNDGWTLYAQRDPITKEPLTIVGNAFTVIGLLISIENLPKFVTIRRL